MPLTKALFTICLQVKLLETHVRQGVSQLRAAKELSEVAQRYLADAGGARVVLMGCSQRWQGAVKAVHLL